MRLVELSGCVRDEEIEVELALREALINAMVHGNRMNPDKWAHVRCRFEPESGVSIVVGRDRAGDCSRKLERESERSGPGPFVHGPGSHRKTRAGIAVGAEAGESSDTRELRSTIRNLLREHQERAGSRDRGTATGSPSSRSNRPVMNER